MLHFNNLRVLNENNTNLITFIFSKDKLSNVSHLIENLVFLSSSRQCPVLLNWPLIVVPLFLTFSVAMAMDIVSSYQVMWIALLQGFYYLAFTDYLHREDFVACNMPQIVPRYIT